MSWYDYVLPIAGGTGGFFLSGGNPMGAVAGYGLGGMTAQAIHSQGANANAKQGYYDAATQAAALGDKQRKFQMQGLERAEGYYAPARARLQAIYGAPAAMQGAPPMRR